MHLGADDVAQHAKPPPLGMHLGLVRFQVPEAEPPNAADDGLSNCLPVTHTRDPDGVRGSWFQPTLVLMCPFGN